MKFDSDFVCSRYSVFMLSRCLENVCFLVTKATQKFPCKTKSKKVGHFWSETEELYHRSQKCCFNDQKKKCNKENISIGINDWCACLFLLFFRSQFFFSPDFGWWISWSIAQIDGNCVVTKTTSDWKWIQFKFYSHIFVLCGFSPSEKRFYYYYFSFS